MAAALLLGVGLPGSAHADPGDLVPSFGDQGALHPLPVPESAGRQIGAVDPGTGEIFLAYTGDPGPMGAGVRVKRLNPDGTSDESFGDQGVRNVDFGAAYPDLYLVAVLPLPGGGAAILAHLDDDEKSSAVGVAVLDGHGGFDPEFSNGQPLIAQLDSGLPAFGLNMPSEIARDHQGRYLVSVLTYDFPSPQVPPGPSGLLRITPSGELDESFDGDGRLIFPVSVSPGRISVTPDDGVYVVGPYPGTTKTPWLPSPGPDIVKVTPGGALDDSFAGDGVLFLPAERPGWGDYAVALREGGGLDLVGNQDDLVRARLLATGELDPAYGESGILSQGVGASSGSVALPALLPTRKALLARRLAGQSLIARAGEFAGLDESFGEGGLVELPEALRDGRIDRIDPLDDRALVMGTSQVDGGSVPWALMLDLTFDSSPITTINSAPSQPTNAPRFGFSADQPGSSFECRVDAGAYEPCGSQFAPQGVSDGDHRFEVRATNTDGMTDEQPAGADFTVDTFLRAAFRLTQRTERRLSFVVRCKREPCGARVKSMVKLRKGTQRPTLPGGRRSVDGPAGTRLPFSLPIARRIAEAVDQGWRGRLVLTIKYVDEAGNRLRRSRSVNLR